MTTAVEPHEPQPAPPPRRTNTRRLSETLAWQIGNFALMLCIVAASVYTGLYVRRAAWEMAYQIHFRISLNNAIKWGHYTNQVGILNVYQKLIDEYGEDLNREPGDGRLALDYPPLRLLIMARWEAWTEVQERVADEQKLARTRRVTDTDRARMDRLFQNRNWMARWQNNYEFNRPMLQINTACEFAGAVAMFLLVHYWLRQCGGAPAKQWIQPLRCAWPALFSALLLWFSPAVIFNAHSYPQWDVWILAPFLLAIYFGMLDLWLVSGILIGVVSMGKGQILMVTPALIVWQLVLLRPGAVIRLGVGIMLAIGLVASPWLTGNPLAATWILSAAFGLFWMLPLFLLRGRSVQYLMAVAAISLIAARLVLWPWDIKPYPPGLHRAMLAFAALAIAARLLPRSWFFTWAAAGIATALFACVPVFNTSMAWYWVGIKFPTEHWQLLYWCHAMNLGAILQNSYGWNFDDSINLLDYLPFLKAHFFDSLNQILSSLTNVFSPMAGTSSAPSVDWRIFPMRYLMIITYVIATVLCGVGMAIHTRRRARMFFFAMVAPWVLMFAILPQMQNRYSVWAAAFAAATASFSFDGFLLFLLLNAINVANTGLDMYFRAQNTDTSRKWYPLISPMFPGVGWAVLLIAAIYLYLALRRDRKELHVP